MEVLSKSLNETENLVKQVAEKLLPGSVLALYGDLGSAKTTFTRLLVSALGITSRVQSPTFVIARIYSGGKGKIKKVNHLDLYRLTTKEELSDLGLKDYFNERDSITVIEWPKLVEEDLPKDTISIFFKYIDENTRRICVQNLN